MSDYQMNSDRASNVMPALFLVTIIVIIGVFAYLYMQQGTQVTTLQEKIDAQNTELPPVPEKNVETPIKEEKDTSVALKQGYFVEQENGVSTISLRDSFGSFTFKAPENIWGIPRVEVTDYTATDGKVALENISRFVGYKFRAGNYYSEGKKGYVFELLINNPKYVGDAPRWDNEIRILQNDTQDYSYWTFTDDCITEKYCSKKDAVEINNAIAEIMKTLVFAK